MYYLFQLFSSEWAWVAKSASKSNTFIYVCTLGSQYLQKIPKLNILYKEMHTIVMNQLP